jgi:hypothetical protein
MFSNGGTNSATQLLLVLHSRLHSLLPLLGSLFDSCPAKGTYWKPQTAMALSLRPKDIFSRILADLIAHGILFILYTWILVLGNENPASLMRRTLLDRGIVAGITLEERSSGAEMVKGKACYLYPEADDQVDWMDIKEHAKEARGKGWVVEEVVFEGSAHCAHFSKEGETYVGVMKGMWLYSGGED